MATIASASPSASTPFQFSSLSEANSYRLKAIVERLTFIMNSQSGGIRFDSSEFFSLCFALARGVDYALTINDIPGVSHRLPTLIKQVCQRRNESSLQPAIMMLMISVKNACKNKWFVPKDADELLNMTNELFSSFCMTVSASPGVGGALDIISQLISRFYPQFKLGSLLVSFDAKPGYEILMSDFQVPRNIPPEEKLMLVVVKTDNLETSSCIISPPQVSFLINGKGVDRRTNVSPDSGPQFPTDITKMLKYGTNIIQSIGYFSGTYLITLAFMSKITLCCTPILKDYVQPVAATAGSDSEVFEAASRITLNCPISFRRIKTPVKGHLCKHHQCFDYENFITMNSRKPSWRCPFCNQPVSFIDLRIDQHMVKILNESGEDAIDVVISADGSWKAVAEHDGNKDQLRKENVSGQQDHNIERASPRSASIVVDAIDLTTGDDGKCKSATSPNQSENHASGTVDTKPFKNTLDFPVHQFLTETSTSQVQNIMWSSILSSISASNEARGVGIPESALAFVPANDGTIDISLANNREIPTIPESTQPNLSCQYLAQVSPLAESMQLSSRFGNSIINHEAGRLPIPTHVTRTPIAVQALAVPAQPSRSLKRMRINGPNLSALSSNDSLSAAYQYVHPATASGDTERQHVSRTSDLSMSQDIRTPALQHVVSLPAPNLTASSVVPPIPQRGAGAYRASSSLDGQGLSRNLSNLRSLIMPGTFNRSSSGLPLEASRELARQIAQRQSQLQAGAVNPQASRTPISELSRSIPELPRDKDWRPTGRMRGSLTGSAYSAALNQYVAPTAAQVKSSTAPTPVNSVASSDFPTGGLQYYDLGRPNN